MDKSLQQPAALDAGEAQKGVSEPAALATGGLAALLAGACCVVPFVLVSAGLGGAWLASLQSLQPYRPVFIAIAFAALAFAGWRIYRPAAACEASAACALPRAKRGYKIGFWSVAVLLVLMVGFPYLAPLFY